MSLVAVVLMMSLLTMLSLAMFTISSAVGRQQRAEREGLRALYVAEAGLARSWEDFRVGNEGWVGGAQDPVKYGDAHYWVQPYDLGGGIVSLVATGDEGGYRARVELVAHRVQNDIWTWGAFGDEQLVMDSNARVDSYDSTLGAYEDQDVNGSGSNRYANANGDIGSNGSIHLSSNAATWGDATPGPSSSVTIDGNATVSGATAPAVAPVDMPPLSVPTYGSSGSLTVSDDDSHSLVSGNHEFDSLVLDSNSTLTIQGPASIVIGSCEIQSNAEVWVDASAGPVDIYVRDDFILNSNTIISSLTKTPADVRIMLESDNVIDPDLDVDLDEVDFDSNAQAYAVIYAPHAAVAINSNFELFGSIVSRSLLLDSNARIHYDEALANADLGQGQAVRAVCWRRVPRNYVPVAP